MGIRLNIVGADIINLGEENITECTYTTETQNEANARSTDIANILIIKGKIYTAIGGEIADDSMKIAEWASVRAENPDAYRKVTIEVFSISRIVRKRGETLH